MQRRSAALHGNLGSCLCDALQEGIADAVACLPVLRAKVLSSFCVVAYMLLFLVRFHLKSGLLFTRRSLSGGVNF
jgi:hypothetical protein